MWHFFLIKNGRGIALYRVSQIMYESKMTHHHRYVSNVVPNMGHMGYTRNEVPCNDNNVLILHHNLRNKYARLVRHRILGNDPTCLVLGSIYSILAFFEKIGVGRG